MCFQSGGQIFCELLDFLRICSSKRHRCRCLGTGDVKLYTLRERDKFIGGPLHKFSPFRVLLLDERLVLNSNLRGVAKNQMRVRLPRSRIRKVDYLRPWITGLRAQT